MRASGTFSRGAQLWLAMTVALAAFLLASPASAAVGDLSFDSCLSQDGSAGDCTDIGGDAFDGPASVAISPDGDSLYVASTLSDSVTHFLVGPNGQLTFAGCVSNDGSAGTCADVPGAAFDVPNALLMSPDGDSLYVGSLGSNSVSHFFATPTGQLTFGGCVSDTGSGGSCANVPGAAFSSPIGLAMSPDGDSLYAGAISSNSVSHFSAIPTGQLTFAGCVSNDGSAGACANLPGSHFVYPRALAVSPDGDSLYVGARNGNSVSHFIAAPAGQPTFAGCVSDSGSGGSCADVPGAAFIGPQALAVSRDGATLYVGATTSDSVSRFSAAPAGQITFADCVSNDGSAGACVDVPGSAFRGDYDFAAIGGSLYISGSASKSVSHFVAAPTGQLTFSNCVSNDGSGGSCTDIPGSVLDIPLGIAAGPGDSLYAIAYSSDSLSRLARVPADTTPPGLTLKAAKAKAGKPVKVTVACDEICTVDLTGTAKPKGSKKGSLKPVSIGLTGGEAATLKLKPKGKLGKALRRSGKGKATIVATATDAVGNSVGTSKRVKLK